MHAQPASWVDLELGVTDRSYPFVGVSEREDCRLDHVAIYPAESGCLTFYSVTGANATRVLRDLEGVGVECSLFQKAVDEFLLSIHVPDTTACPGTTLASCGALLQELHADRGVGRVCASLPPDRPTTDVVDELHEHHPTVDVVATRRRTGPIPDNRNRELVGTGDPALTDRQFEVLTVAHRSGYFDRPRESSGREIAEAMGISQPTFSEHLRIAQAKVFDSLLGDGALNYPIARS